jgi:hypothetical protein
MRYQFEDDLVWTDGNNVTHKLKQFREIPEYTILREEVATPDLKFDELASRINIYGEGNEGDAYKIAEANTVELVEGDFEIANLKKIGVPA